ncbi:MAG: hypothetical protein LUI06_04205 [Ruminococcus sp.]|nr:hypothetical protein [Ruminococcus sp.]
MYADDYGLSYSVIRLVVVNIVWIVVGIVMGNKAKAEGLSFSLYFILTWLLGVVGLIITLCQINSQKKRNGMQNMYQNQNFNPYMNQGMNQNPYGQPNGYVNPNQNPNPYGQYGDPNMASNSRQGFSQNESTTETVFYTCPNCGGSQKESGYCRICGAKMK